MKKIKKKLLCGVLLLILLLSMPFSNIDLASGTVRTDPVLPDAAPDPQESPAVTDGQYSLSIESSVGILTYYNQSDARWGGYLYGGQDPLRAYGCGPTVLAMLVSSFTARTIQPPEMSDWAAANRYWSPQSGSQHSLIPEGAAAFGLRAVPFQNLTPEGVLAELASGHILVALMGPGHFTSSGHFIIIADYWSGSQVRVVDPANLERTQTPWELDVILSELSRSANAGGPVWSISPG